MAPRVFSRGQGIGLEQIVVLKFLGLGLRDIGRLMKRQSPLVQTLQGQQLVLLKR